MFIDMIAVHVVEMTIMKIVDMPIMANCRMSTVWAMAVGMLMMMRLDATGR
jgi:hypothetical protein